MILGEHYRLIRELGQGGFGRTYLAEDVNRYNERCVLKEFVPQVQGDYALRKAEELFQREAGVLYQLNHPQIPRFRELMRVQLETGEKLFLVQDYVEGQTYRALLDARRPQGLCFSELEVTQLLRQILPVLDYIHGLGVIHRDIAPDNLISRYQDSLPVLIDFGGVKQVAAAVAQQLSDVSEMPTEIRDGEGERFLTRLGKVGYAPPEQMQSGMVSPASDLYALGTTVLTLLTGKEPQELMDQQTLAWTWPQQITLSPLFSGVLQRLLVAQPSDRYQSAAQVIAALDGDPAAGSPNAIPPTVIPPAEVMADSQLTRPLTAGGDPSTLPEASPVPAQAFNGPVTIDRDPVPAPQRQGGSGIWQSVMGLALILGALWTLVWLINPGQRFRNAANRPSNPEPVQTDDAQFSGQEQKRKELLRDRRQTLGVSNQFLVDLTNAEFYRQYPSREGILLKEGPEDEVWRSRWDAVASTQLDLIEANLSPAARSNLGNYTLNDLDRWGQVVNQLNLSSQALYDLADGKFAQAFPEQSTQDLLNLPAGQIWYGIVADEVQAIQSGARLQEIQFAPNSFSQQVSGDLQSGAGMAYIINLAENQLMRLNLQAPSQSTLLSIYLPNAAEADPFLLADSPDTTWSGRLSQSGYYEIVVVSKANEAIRYQLTVAADNVTATPVEPEEEEESGSESGQPDPNSDSGTGDDAPSNSNEVPGADSEGNSSESTDGAVNSEAGN